MARRAARTWRAALRGVAVITPLILGIEAESARLLKNGDHAEGWLMRGVADCLGAIGTTPDEAKALRETGARACVAHRAAYIEGWARGSKFALALHGCEALSGYLNRSAAVAGLVPEPSEWHRDTSRHEFRSWGTRDEHDAAQVTQRASGWSWWLYAPGGITIAESDKAHPTRDEAVNACDAKARELGILRVTST